jgi:hypothetical protein
LDGAYPSLPSKLYANDVDHLRHTLSKRRHVVLLEESTDRIQGIDMAL